MSVLPRLVVGDGPACAVLLHGFLGSGRNLMGLARALSALRPDLRVVVPTLRGHAGAPPLPATPRLEDLAADVVALAGECGADALVGHSLGGRVALVASAIAKRRLPVILLDIAPGPVSAGQTGQVLAALRAAPAAAPGRRAMGEALVAAGAPPDLVPWLCTNLVRTPEGVAWGFDREALARLHGTETSRDLWPLVERARVPIPVAIRGGRSPFVPPDEARRLAEHGARVVTVDGAGHFLHVEAREAVADHLARSVPPVPVAPPPHR